MPCASCADLQQRVQHLQNKLAAIYALSVPQIEQPPRDELDFAFDVDAMGEFLDRMQKTEDACRAFLKLSNAKRGRLTVTELRNHAAACNIEYAGTRSALLVKMVRVAAQTVRVANESEAILRETSCVSDALP